jgi:hypothetical protein
LRVWPTKSLAGNTFGMTKVFPAVMTPLIPGNKGGKIIVD